MGQEVSVPQLLAETSFRGILICTNGDRQAGCRLPMQAPPHAARVKSQHREVPSSGAMSSHCEAHWKAEKAPVRYLQRQISSKWWLSKHRRWLTVPGFNSFKFRAEWKASTHHWQNTPSSTLVFLQMTASEMAQKCYKAPSSQDLNSKVHQTTPTAVSLQKPRYLGHKILQDLQLKPFSRPVSTPKFQSSLVRHIRG